MFSTGEGNTVPAASDAKQVGLSIGGSSLGEEEEVEVEVVVVVVGRLGSNIMMGPERSEGVSAVVHVSSESGSRSSGFMVVELWSVGVDSLCFRFLTFLSPLKERGLTMMGGGDLVCPEARSWVVP